MKRSAESRQAVRARGSSERSTLGSKRRRYSLRHSSASGNDLQTIEDGSVEGVRGQGFVNDALNTLTGSGNGVKCGSHVNKEVNDTPVMCGDGMHLPSQQNMHENNIRLRKSRKNRMLSPKLHKLKQVSEDECQVVNLAKTECLGAKTFENLSDADTPYMYDTEDKFEHHRDITKDMVDNADVGANFKLVRDDSGYSSDIEEDDVILATYVHVEPFYAQNKKMVTDSLTNLGSTYDSVDRVYKDFVKVYAHDHSHKAVSVEMSVLGFLRAFPCISFI